MQQKIKYLSLLATIGVLRSGTVIENPRICSFSNGLKNLVHYVTRLCKRDVPRDFVMLAVQPQIQINSVTGNRLFMLEADTDTQVIVSDLHGNLSAYDLDLPITALCSALAAWLDVDDCRLFWSDTADRVETGCIRDLLYPKYIASNSPLMISSKVRLVSVTEEIIGILRKYLPVLSNIQMEDIALKLNQQEGKIDICILGIEYLIPENPSDSNSSILVKRGQREMVLEENDLAQLRLETLNLIALINQRQSLAFFISKYHPLSSEALQELGQNHSLEFRADQKRLFDIKTKLIEIAKKYSTQLSNIRPEQIYIELNKVDGQFAVAFIGTEYAIGDTFAGFYVSSLCISQQGFNPIEFFTNDLNKLKPLYTFFVTHGINVCYLHQIGEKIRIGLSKLKNQQTIPLGKILEKGKEEELHLREVALQALEKLIISGSYRKIKIDRTPCLNDSLTSTIIIDETGGALTYRSVFTKFPKGNSSSEYRISDLEVSRGEVSFSYPDFIKTDSVCIPRQP